MDYRGILLTLFTALVVGGLVLWVSHGTVARAASSEQIVFSGAGSLTLDPAIAGHSSTPFGFWIWCEDNGSTNPYHGKCSGSMYFYDLGITRGVKGAVAETSGIYTMSVVSTLDNAVACALSNDSTTITSGPTNTVNVVCAAPAGTGSAPNSVITVTGP
jgi:hypothetical protein